MYPRRLRKFWPLFVICGCIFILYFFLFEENVDLTYSADYDFNCDDHSSNTSIRHICFKEPHVFFVETSGSDNLTSRQACAVESTARHNPSLQVYVLMTPTGVIANNNLLNKLHNIPNVNLLKVDIDVLVHGSPIFKWFRTGKWKKSEWKISHLSDALRFLLIWKFGGIYLDLDIVTLRPLDHLRNAAVTENWDRVAAGILFFDKGHELIRRCMFEFAKKYDPYNFVNNGPGIFTKNLKEFCETNVVDKISGSSCDINILPPEAAFPIPYEQYEDYFVPSTIKNITTHFNSSYMIHVWNKFSKYSRLKVGENSLYELAIKQNCPSVYDHIKTLEYI